MRARNPENRGRGGKEFDWKRGEGGDNDRKIVGGRGSIEKCRLGGGAIRPEPRPSRVCRPRVGIRRQEMPAEFPSGRIPFLGKGLGTPISRKFLSTIRSLHSPIALPSLYSNVVIKLFSTAFSNFDRSSNIKDGLNLEIHWSRNGFVSEMKQRERVLRSRCLLIAAKGSPLRERRRVGKKEKRRRKALLLSNRTQTVVSLTVYDDGVYIYIYMHSAMWPVDSSSSSLFFLPPLVSPPFIKSNPPLFFVVASKRGNDISVYVRSTTGWTSPRSRQTGRPKCFSSPFHVFSPPPFIPCFLLLSFFSFSFFFRNDENTYFFSFLSFFRGKKKLIGSYKLYYRCIYICWNTNKNVEMR